MKNYVVICLLIGAMSSSLVANSLTINNLGDDENPCPSNFTGLLPNPEDCHSFYICDAGFPGLIPCPAGLCFNPEGVEGGACDNCDEVPGCQGLTGEPTPSTSGPPNTSTDSPPGSSSPSEGTTTPRGDNPCPSNFTGLLPNPEDCHSFYICDAGFPGLFPCPAGLCFNPEGAEGGACDHCDLVPGCESATGGPSSSPNPSTPSSTTSPTTTSSPTEKTTSRPTEETETTTRPTTNTTPPTTSSSSTTSERTTTSNGEELSCPPDVPFIYMPYPGDCNKFYYCQSGVNTGVYNCGTGLWFNFRQQVCTAPWGASCED